MNISDEMLEEFAEVAREISELDTKDMRAKLESAQEEYIARIQKQAQQWKYFCSYAIYDPNGVLKIIDSGIFFMDNEISTQEDMFFLDYTVSSFVKPEGDSFVKLISWHCLGKPNGTV